MGMQIPTDGSSNGSAAPGIAEQAAFWALGIIFAANFLNYLDRFLVSAVEKQITGDIRLDEFEFGLLWTLFTVGYMCCAVPIGLIADRYSRTRLFAACVAVWSFATIVTGLATWKTLLYSARVFIGMGEAGCLVIGPSLISDFFDRGTRGRALSIFYLGMPLGGTAAFIFAAVFFEIGFGWRGLFYLAGFPGLIIAPIIWVMSDPPRGATERETSIHSPTGGLHDYWQLLRNRTLLLIILAQAFSVTVLVPLLHFGKKFFLDKHGLGELQASLILLSVMVAGAIGNSVSGWIGDRLAVRFKGAYAMLAGFGFLIAWPCLVVGFTAGSAWVFLPALALGSFCSFLCMPAVNTQIANVVNPVQRGTAWALAVLVLHLLGDMLAPPIFGQVSKHISRQTAFTIFSVALAPAILCCFAAARTAAGDIARFVNMTSQDGASANEEEAVSTSMKSS